jgi:hypothetical protein
MEKLQALQKIITEHKEWVFLRQTIQLCHSDKFLRSYGLRFCRFSLNLEWIYRL